MRHCVTTSGSISTVLSKGASFGFDNFNKYMKKRKWGKPVNITATYLYNDYNIEKRTIEIKFDILKKPRFTTVKKVIPLDKREYYFLQKKYDFQMKRLDKLLDKRLK